MASILSRGVQGGFGADGTRSRPWLAVAMVIGGAAAVALPQIAGFSVLWLVAALFLLNGAVQIGWSLTAPRLRTFAWHALVGVLYLAAGGYLLIKPEIGLASLALLMAVIFLIEGALLVAGYWATRRMRGAVWLLINGALAMALGALVIVGWPEASGEMIGVLLGANLIFAGVTRLVARAP